MAKLIINPTSSSRRDLALPRSLLSIGRDPSNDLVLPDAMVSRRHAVIEFRGSQYVLRDCNSSNGSLVNGDRVTERGLRDGDLVAIGTARLLFRDEVAGEEAGAKVVQHPSAPRLVCPSCSADYRKGDQFCRQCGAGLAPSTPAKAVCTSCGTAVVLPAKFCNACGRSLGPEASPVSATTEAPALVAPSEPGRGSRLAASGQAQAERSVEAPSPEVRAASAPAVGDAPPPAGAPATPEVSAAAIPVAVAAPVATSPFTPLREPKRKPPADTIDPGTVPFLRHPLVQAPASKPIQGLGSGAAMRSAIGAAPAGFGRRLAAGLIDHALVAFGQALLVAPVAWYWWARRSPADPSDVTFLPIVLSLLLVPLAAILGTAYFVYGWGVRGATPGKRALGIAVEGADSSFPIGLSRAALRLFGYALSGMLLGVGFVMIASEGGALHDRMAGTRVTRRGAS